MLHPVPDQDDVVFELVLDNDKLADAAQACYSHQRTSNMTKALFEDFNSLCTMIKHDKCKKIVLAEDKKKSGKHFVDEGTVM